MKFLRLIILILLSLSVPLLGLAIWIFFGIVEIFPEWKMFAIISSVFAGIIFIFSWFLLNKKAKIVGGIFGGILTIISFLVLFFWNFLKENPEKLNENFLKNFENSENVFENPTIGKSENIFDNIFPLGENILEFDKSEEKIPKILSAEKCVEISKSVSFLYDKSENLFKKNQRTREIEGKREFFKNFLILSEIANLTGKRNITENDEKIITEKWEEFKKISPNAKIIEKNLIFTTEYRENYEKFLKIMWEIVTNHDGKIYCDNRDYESKYFEITIILWTNLVLSSVFDEEKYFDETLKILEKFLENRKQKYMPNDKNHPPLVNAMTNLTIDGIALSSMEMVINASENGERFANLKKILTENNRWEEYKNLVWRQEFYYVQQNVEDFENEKINSKFFIKSEFDEYLRHFYVEKMRRAGVENLPKTIFSDVEDLEEKVGELTEKYGDESFLGKMKLT